MPGVTAMKLKIHSDSKPSRFRLTPLTLFISALTLFVGPHAYAESTWESSPIDLMGTGVPWSLTYWGLCKLANIALPANFLDKNPPHGKWKGQTVIHFVGGLFDP